MLFWVIVVTVIIDFIIYYGLLYRLRFFARAVRFHSQLISNPNKNHSEFMIRHFGDRLPFWKTEKTHRLKPHTATNQPNNSRHIWQNERKKVLKTKPLGVLSSEVDNIKSNEQRAHISSSMCSIKIKYASIILKSLEWNADETHWTHHEYFVILGIDYASTQNSNENIPFVYFPLTNSHCTHGIFSILCIWMQTRFTRRSLEWKKECTTKLRVL